MVNRVVLTLEQSEYSALLKDAIKELRNPSDQAMYILRCELERRGLLPIHEVDKPTQAIPTKLGAH